MGNLNTKLASLKLVFSHKKQTGTSQLTVRYEEPENCFKSIKMIRTSKKYWFLYMTSLVYSNFLEKYCFPMTLSFGAR